MPNRQTTTAAQPSGDAATADQDREFEKLDRNSDGYLNTTEIQARRGLSMMRNSDTNHDGHIDRAEFSAFETTEQESRNDAAGSDDR